MSTIVTIPNNVTPAQLTESRDGFAQASGQVYGAGRTYAANLLGFLGTAWIELAHDAKGAEGDAMRTERDALYAALRALPIPHSNPSVKWKQIKDHARSILAEQAKAEGGEDAEGEGEAEGSGNGKHTRTLQLRLIEDLTTLYKACKKEKARTEQQSKAMLHIAAALADLGVDISKL
jgi:hypothetical protein